MSDGSEFKTRGCNTKATKDKGSANIKNRQLSYNLKKNKNKIYNLKIKSKKKNL